MLVVRVSSLTGNVVAQLDKVPGELAKTANDQCNIPPLDAIRLKLDFISAHLNIRLHFSVHCVAGVPGVQVLGVLFKVQLDALCPFFNRNGSLR